MFDTISARALETTDLPGRSGLARARVRVFEHQGKSISTRSCEGCVREIMYILGTSILPKLINALGFRGLFIDMMMRMSMMVLTS